MFQLVVQGSPALITPVADRLMARARRASMAGFHAWLQRPPLMRAEAVPVLLKRVQHPYDLVRPMYHEDARLQASGEKHGRKRTAPYRVPVWSERAIGMAVRSQPVLARGAVRHPTWPTHELNAAGSDRLWIAHITCAPTAPGLLYLAVELDSWSRKVVGWSTAADLKR